MSDLKSAKKYAVPADDVFLAYHLKVSQARLCYPIETSAVWPSFRKSSAAFTKHICRHMRILQTEGRKPTFYFYPEITKNLMFEKCEFCEE